MRYNFCLVSFSKEFILNFMSRNNLIRVLVFGVSLFFLIPFMFILANGVNNVSLFNQAVVLISLGLHGGQLLSVLWTSDTELDKVVSEDSKKNN